MIPSTTNRVPRNTAPRLNQKIQQNGEHHLICSTASGRHDDLVRRLVELDREWDIERVLEANAASVGLIGLVLGATVNRRWFALPAAVCAFLLQHAVQGWCPPLSLFRRLGVRTAREIDEERNAIKALRGDFRSIKPRQGKSSKSAARRALRAARR